MAEELGMTSEEAGRKARYDAFREVGSHIMKEYSLSKDQVKILVAQNANDQAETILFRILRGTGPDGLSGIAYLREDESGFRVARPILDIKRAEIERYCEEKGLEPRRDHTNEEALYSRNKIRLKLIPFLEKEFNPSVIDTLNRLGRLAEDDKGYIYQNALKAYKDIRTEEHGLDIKGLMELERPLRRRVLLLALSDMGLRENVTEKHLKAIESVAVSRNHKLAYTELPGGFRAARNKKELIFYKEDEK
jgi:tRNA(Ile)-lysidine synthase